MGWCALFGHSYATFAGHGQYAGQAFQVCTRCNKTNTAGPVAAGAETVLPFLVGTEEPALEYPTVAE